MADSNRGPIHHQRIRAPRHSGETLQLPPLSEIGRTWQSNQAAREAQQSQPVEMGDQTHRLGRWREMARAEMQAAACRWTNRYLDQPPMPTSTGDVVMTGHQPGLVHPGVWYKNFVLAELGQRWQALPIHVIIDSDLAGEANVRLPLPRDGGWQWGSVAFDAAGVAAAYEARPVQDPDLLQTLPQRLREVWSAVEAPLLEDLWPEVLQARERLGPQAPLGHLLAAGRHRLESRLGLRTWEVPLSWLAATPTFARFSWRLLADLPSFHAVFDPALTAYRQVHRIRSQAHPVPRLESDGQWREAPFWVWTRDQPRRQRLWVLAQDDVLQLSNRQGWEVRWRREHLLADWQRLFQEGVAIRPRALITTLYCRWLLSDLFLHGIGGAKYDQLTDTLAESYLGQRLPEFQTLTATFQLPLNTNLVTAEQVTQQQVMRRQMRFHPERFLHQPDAQAQSWIDAKLAWINHEAGSPRSRAGQRELARLNALLRARLQPPDGELEQEIQRARQRLRSSQIAGWREFSFCLHPRSLVDQLRAAARIPESPATSVRES